MEISLRNRNTLRDEDIVSTSRESLEGLNRPHRLTTYVKITNAPIYYANNVIKFVSRGKFTSEKDGFDGFRVSAEFLKSRTNKAGQATTLIYNQDFGFDPILTQLEMLDELKLLNGRNPYRFIGTNDAVKFNSKNFREEFRTRPEVQEAVFNTTLPILKRQISDVYGEEKQDFQSHVDILQKINDAYARDLMDEFDKKIAG